jgi:hypothetical protein
MEAIAMTRVHLTESSYLSALQCDRKLWLDVHAPEESTPTLEARQHIYRMEDEVRAAARNLFPTGVRVTAAVEDHDLAFDQTRALVADTSVSAIFDAAFEFEGARVRVDVLERMGAGPARFGIRAVTPSTYLKEAEQLPGLALQKWVLERCGLAVQSVELIHVDPEYVRGSGAINAMRFFARIEVASRLGEAEMDEVGRRRDSVWDVLMRPAPPHQEPGAICRRPHLCEYWDACTAEKSPTWFADRPGAHADRRAVLLEVAETQKSWISESLGEELEAVQAPFWALEFGVIGAAIPLFEGTLPYQPVAFQWSLQRLAETGEIEHFEFLADGRKDPRPEVAASLIDAVGRDQAPILVYSGYELRRLKELAASVPAQAEDLHAIAGRLVDLLPLVRRNVYHPDFLGSYSLNFVTPALVPEMNYGSLIDRGDGSSPIAAFVRLASGCDRAQDEAADRARLLALGQRNTRALVEVHRALVEIASEIKTHSGVDDAQDTATS